MISVHDVSRALVHPRRAAAASDAAAPARSHQRVDQLTALALLALGVLVLVTSLKMGIGWGSDGPQGGFVPFWLSVVLILSSGAILAQALRAAVPKTFATRKQLGCVLKVLVPAATMLLVIPLIGIYVAGAIYMAFYMKWCGRYRWSVSLALPLAITLSLFVVFERWFLVQLPKGPFEIWLGF